MVLKFLSCPPLVIFVIFTFITLVSYILMNKYRTDNNIQKRAIHIIIFIVVFCLLYYMYYYLCSNNYMAAAWILLLVPIIIFFIIILAITGKVSFKKVN